MNSPRVRLQRAHAHLLGQGQGLAVVGGSLVDGWGLATPGDLAEEPGRMRLVAMTGVGVRELEETFGKGMCLIRAADEQTRLAQLGEHQRMERHAPAGGQALQHLIQEREGLRRTPGQGIRRTQEGGRYEESQRYVGALGEHQAPFQHGDRLLDHLLAAVAQPNTIQHKDLTGGLRHRLRQSYGFFSYTRPLGEARQFGQTQGDIATAD
jgi:hypothetical protein